MIVNRIKNYYEIIFTSLIGFAVIIWGKFLQCQQSVGLGFDQQSFLFWDYAKSTDLIPFKDFFYPYGLLFFLKTDSLFWYFISLIIVFLVVCSLFFTLKKLFKDRLYTYIFFLIFCLFLNIFVDFDSLVRYGPLIFISVLISYFAEKRILINKFAGSILGLILGFLFFLITDLFLYGFLTIFVFTAIYVMRIYKKIDKNFIVFLFSLLLGIIIGIIPLLIYLYSSDAYIQFINNFILLKDISVFAKVPFPPSLRSFENQFVICLIILTILTLYTHIKKIKKYNFSFYIKLSLLIIILLLEQKNIIRSFSQQISLIGLFLFVVLLSDLKINFEKIKINTKALLIFNLSLVLLVMCLFYLERGSARSNYSFFNQNKKCIDEKLLEINKNDLRNYNSVVNYIKKDKNSTIFSFPGDSIYYVLFKQIPPYYPSIYEATPIYAQKKLINYMKKNKIQYVIYNLHSSAIQDGVPDKVRSKKLFEYIKDNYKYVEEIGEFKILKRTTAFL